MFGFSLQKLAILVTIVAAVWYGFKLVKRLQDAREIEARKKGGAGTTTSARRRDNTDGATAHQDAEQMVQCPVCDTYVPSRRTPNCGRSGCPY